MRAFLRYLLLMSGCTLLTGCLMAAVAPVVSVAGKLAETDPPEVRITFNAVDDSNDGAPLIVRFFELKGKGAFNAAAYESFLLDKPEEKVGDIINWDERDFDPGQIWELKKELDSKARYLGIFAAYRDPSHGQWRVVIETPPDRTAVAEVTLRASEVELVDVKHSRW